MFVFCLLSYSKLNLLQSAASAAYWQTSGGHIRLVFCNLSRVVCGNSACGMSGPGLPGQRLTNTPGIQASLGGCANKLRQNY